MANSYYKYHVFFCTNKRTDGRQCCEDYGANNLRDYAKGDIKKAGLQKEGGVRVNTAGCLNRCSEGPVMVVYPEAVWYTYIDQDDVDEILQEHLVNGRLVERLQVG